MSDKDNRGRFFGKSFLLADVKLDTVLMMLFLTMSNANIDFQAQNLQWRSYTTGDVLPTTRQIELIKKKTFAVATFDLKHKIFVVHVAALSVDLGDEVNPSKKAQIAHLKVDKAPIEVLSKYADFADIFSPKLAAKLPEHRVNNCAINHIYDRQPSYGPFYSLKPVELETLKGYIKNIQANGFIRPFKSLTKASILFDKKPDSSLRLYVDYQDLNNLTMNNWYPLLLVEKSLD